jgi:hypothetical protein
MKNCNPLGTLQTRIKKAMSRARLRSSDEEFYCVMVHAGAGYHSTQHEIDHLKVVEE